MAELIAGSVEQAFGGLGRDIQRFGNLGVRVVLIFVQNQGFALAFDQLRDAVADEGNGFGTLQGAVGHGNGRLRMGTVFARC